MAMLFTTPHAIPLTPHEALSGIFGSISLVSWIVVLVPQLLQNYFTSSADAISLTFLLIWFIGDVTNLAGSLWAHLVPTVSALAIYFCFADAILISQCLYYNILNRRRQRSLSVTAAGAAGNIASREDDEEAPLLSRRGSSNSNSGGTSNVGLPGSHSRRLSSTAGRKQTGSDASGLRRESILAKIAEEDGMNGDTTESGDSSRAWLRNMGSILFICIIGTLGWFVAYKIGVWTPAPPPSHHHADAGGKRDSAPLGASVLGYISAILYLGARIPQIIKNWRQKSCEGLSLLFFLLSLLGNLTYGAGILFHSVESRYLITNLPWLIGSLGTMVEDVMIFIQFHMYGERQQDNDEAVVV